MPRKVKVVDVVPDNNDTNTDNTVHELEPIPEENQQTDTKEQVQDNETQSDPVKEDTNTKDIIEEQDIEEIPKTKAGQQGNDPSLGLVDGKDILQSWQGQ